MDDVTVAVTSVSSANPFLYMLSQFRSMLSFTPGSKRYWVLNLQRGSGPDRRPT